MAAARFMRGVLTEDATEDAAGGPRVVQALVRGVREAPDVPLMQQRGLASMPKTGDVIGIEQVDDLVVAVSSESTDRPALEAGDTSLYASKDVYVLLKQDGTIKVVGKNGAKVTISTDSTVQVEGTTINLKAPYINLGGDSSTATPLDGVVTGQCICCFTGAPHPVKSTAVRAAMAGAA